MKRQRLPPLTPSTPLSTVRLTKSIIKSIKTKKHLNPKASSSPPSSAWESLQIGRSELSLPLTFPTGQTFIWKQTGPTQYTGPINSHLISLRQMDGPDDSTSDVAFFIHHTPDRCRAVTELGDFLNLGVSLAGMWRRFSEADGRFADLAPHLEGARVLRQEPVECLFQFLCSSNNNIGRITKMVGVLSSFGRCLGSVGGFDFHEFPSLERLEMVSEEELRKAGFGYRAKYIVGTVKALQSKPGGGAEWLSSLRGLELHEVIDALCTLPGVGPKVAACIALFSLDQHHAIPVDTHVWKIATRYLIPELAGARLTPKLCSHVAEAFVNKFGKYAGWAQNVLFIGELSSQKALIPSHLHSLKETKSARKECGKQEVAIEVFSGSCKMPLLGDGT
ncbi:N-glycosylase/DNA lyase OGG1 isoform X1 [Cinnamomum micranthum f. kanehirae]|uniref:DNA-(apurinic or apyrimidinic site) lyase n=1 Tax=Cinnamomum micranthum f. kanehirae TaxID=337451 RepID=A0A3S3QTF5_9MAGN|nr:N-glycosylase/DNA lyase OGG1 isoform X1 [Cinnamomum micranthum f. kanehirae]